VNCAAAVDARAVEVEDTGLFVTGSQNASVQPDERVNHEVRLSNQLCDLKCLKTLRIIDNYE
jgi:hypothetical protein